MKKYDEVNQMIDDEKERKHKNKKIIFRILGFVFLISGISCMTFGLIDFFKAFSTMEQPTLFYLCFIGVFLITPGIIFLLIGYNRAIYAYFAKDQATVINELTKNIKPAIDTVSDTMNKNQIECPYCHNKNFKDAKYCSNCGKSLIKKCHYCNSENPLDANYCNNCGKKL